MLRLWLAIWVLAAAHASGAEAPARTNATASASTTDPVELQFQKILVMDDESQAEVDRWILDNYEFASRGAAQPREELNQRIFERFAPVRKAYEDFIRQHPDHARARVAYGSFLGDLHDEEGAQVQLEKALELNSKDPAVYNNLANIYGHIGPDVKKAFEYYAKAIELKPDEPVYYHNYGTTVFLFRKDATEYFHISEQEVFDKALDLYSKALKLDPTNFPLATDVANTFYGIRPPRYDAALRAWTNAFALASDGLEREGVHVHFARTKLNAGRFEEARQHLALVTNTTLAEVRKRVARNLAEQEQAARTNSPATNTNSPPKP